MPQYHQIVDMEGAAQYAGGTDSSAIGVPQAQEGSQEPLAAGAAQIADFGELSRDELSGPPDDGGQMALADGGELDPNFGKVTTNFNGNSGFDEGRAVLMQGSSHDGRIPVRRVTA